MQFSGILLILGLFVEALCLIWTPPIAFVLFLGAAGLFLANLDAAHLNFAFASRAGCR